MLSPGESIVVRTTSLTSGSNRIFNKQISSHLKLEVSGDIRTLMNYKTLRNEVGESEFTNFLSNCINITTPVDCSKITSVDNSGLFNCFNGCSSITTPPDFSRVTRVNGLSAFGNCLYNCSSLTKVITPNVPTWDTRVFSNWLKGVSPTGTIYKPKTLEIPTGTPSGIPAGWTTADYEDHQS